MVFMYLIGWVVIAMLVSYLCRRLEIAPRPKGPKLDGVAMDVRPVARRIEQVRRDYLVVVRSHPHDASRRERLQAAAREALRHLSYFRHAHAEAPLPEPDPQQHPA